MQRRDCAVPWQPLCGDNACRHAAVYHHRSGEKTHQKSNHRQKYKQMNRPMHKQQTQRHRSLKQQGDLRPHTRKPQYTQASAASIERITPAQRGKIRTACADLQKSTHHGYGKCRLRKKRHQYGILSCGKTARSRIPANNFRPHCRWRWRKNAIRGTVAFGDTD